MSLARRSIHTLPVLLLFMLLSVSCTQKAVPRQTTSEPAEPTAKRATPTTQEPRRIATESRQPTETATPTASPRVSLFPAATAESRGKICKGHICWYPAHFLLRRPIVPPGRDIIDPTYRYGSTQHGLRETHHGVEFVNSYGTPVVAAANGIVVYAGNDNRQVFADHPYFYGNLVVLRHTFPELNKPVFTLYAHLSKISVHTGDIVHKKDLIGRVGATGTATGSHLHFEVRLGKNNYASTRNPALWLKPHRDKGGHPNGAIAGRILDEFGNTIKATNIVIDKLSKNGTKVLQTYYVETYADRSVNGDDEFHENFAIAELTPGQYRVSFIARGLKRYIVTVYPEKITLITFDASKENTAGNSTPEPSLRQPVSVTSTP